MSVIFVDSAGSNTSPYDTWAKAATSFATGHAALAAGDWLVMKSTYAESVAGTTYAWPGTNAAPNVWISVTPSGAASWSALTPGATMTWGTSSVTHNGCVYAAGINCVSNSGNSVSLSFAATADDYQVWESCSHWMLGANGTSKINYGNSGSATAGDKVILRNVSWKMGNASQRVTPVGRLLVDGGSFASGGTSPTVAFNLPNYATTLICRGVDFSNLSSTVNLVSSTAVSGTQVDFIGCKLPSSWSGTPADTKKVSSDVRLIACSASAVNYAFWYDSYERDLVNETTIVMTGGASDGTTTVSHKITTTANTFYPMIAGKGADIVRWNDTTGSSITVSIHYVHDINVTAGQGSGTGNVFTDKEVWLEVFYNGSSTSPLATYASSKSEVTASASDNASSSSTWTTTGMTTPTKGKVSVTFTPQMKGYITARLVVAAASKTIYYDPAQVIT